MLTIAATGQIARLSSRPFNIAWVLSIAVHLALATGVSLLIINQAPKGDQYVPPQMNLILSSADNTSNSGRDTSVQAAQAAAIISQTTARATVKVKSRPLPKQTRAAYPEPRSNKLVSPVSNKQSLPLIISSIAPSPVQVPSAKPSKPKGIAITPDQQKTLQQQLKQWQDKLAISDNQPEQLSWQQGQQNYNASIRHIAAKNNTELDHAVVEISTELDGVTVSTQMQLKRLAFSHYAQIIDRWDPDVSISEDEIDGRFHANSRIYVDAKRRHQPKFSGKVTTTATVKLLGFARRSGIFLGGLETRVKKIQLPKQLLPNHAETKNEAFIHKFNQNAHIKFQASGGYHWYYDSTPEQVNITSRQTRALRLIGGKDVVFSIKGIINGTVSVYSQKKIIITGNLRYANNPETVTDSLDFLGLLSERYIEIAPPNITGPGDLRIDAAIYAKRRFQVKRFRSRGLALLSIYGSLTAGTVSATEPRFATSIVFDKRFENKRLPNFPMTNKYQLEDWNQQWQVKKTGNSNP